MKRTLCCILQNRLGALDRVLGALTYRGMVPEQMMSSMDSDTGFLQVLLTFECAEDHALDKLVKVLQKQVHVLEAQPVTLSQTTPQTQQANVAPLFTAVTARRRAPHA